MTLLDIMPVLSDNHLIKIGLEGDYQGTFTKDEIKYWLLKMTVASIYPFIVTDNESSLTSFKSYIAVDLVDREGRK